MEEHTKPLFHKHKILAFKNLYNYQICLEILKILKTKIPYYLFQLHPLSSRNNQNFLVANRNSSLFITNIIKLWNNCLKVIFNTQTITETKISKFKLDLKKILLKVQNAFDTTRLTPLNHRVHDFNNLIMDMTCRMSRAGCVSSNTRSLETA